MDKNKDNNLIPLEDLMICFEDKKQEITKIEPEKQLDELMGSEMGLSNSDASNIGNMNLNENKEEKDFQIKLCQPKNLNTPEATWIDKKLSFVSMKEWIDFQKTKWSKCTTIFIVFGDKVKSKLEVLSKHNSMFLNFLDDKEKQLRLASQSLKSNQKANVTLDEFFSNHSNSFQIMMKSIHEYDTFFESKFLELSNHLSKEVIPALKKECTEFQKLENEIKPAIHQILDDLDLADKDVVWAFKEHCKNVDKFESSLASKKEFKKDVWITEYQLNFKIKHYSSLLKSLCKLVFNIWLKARYQLKNHLNKEKSYIEKMLSFQEKLISSPEIFSTIIKNIANVNSEEISESVFNPCKLLSIEELQLVAGIDTTSPDILNKRVEEIQKLKVKEFYDYVENLCCGPLEQPNSIFEEAAFEGERLSGSLLKEWVKTKFIITKEGFLHVISIDDQYPPKHSLQIKKCQIKELPSPCELEIEEVNSGVFSKNQRVTHRFNTSQERDKYLNLINQFKESK